MNLQNKQSTNPTSLEGKFLLNVKLDKAEIKSAVWVDGELIAEVKSANIVEANMYGAIIHGQTTNSKLIGKMISGNFNFLDRESATRKALEQTGKQSDFHSCELEGILTGGQVDIHVNRVEKLLAEEASSVEITGIADE